jgi:AhpD family alkylhydroperoxidase
MARLQGAAGTGRVADLIRQRRGGELAQLDELLLLSPPVAEGWSMLLGAIRGQMSLDGALRELVILRIAVLNGAAYEWQAHEPVARRCGLSEAKIAAIREISGPGQPGPDGAPGPATPLDARERAVLAYADAMTGQITVSGQVFSAVAVWLGPQELMELTATAAAYNMVSRFLVALEIGVSAAGSSR